MQLPKIINRHFYLITSTQFTHNIATFIPSPHTKRKITLALYSYKPPRSKKKSIKLQRRTSEQNQSRKTNPFDHEKKNREKPTPSICTYTQLSLSLSHNCRSDKARKYFIGGKSIPSWRAKVPLKRIPLETIPVYAERKRER